jgi:predicted glycosyltransferase
VHLASGTPLTAGTSLTADSKPPRRLRILFHVQHLRGVGHYVRIGEIAKALARRHDVILTDGGIPVPRPWPKQVTTLPMPRIRRERGKFIALQSTSEIGAVMDARKEILRGTIRTLLPDFVIVEHYPFSRWFIGDEVGSMITQARAANPGVRALCSMRDIHRRSVAEGSDEEFAQEVTARLRAHFDMILTHGDPALISLEEQFPFVSSTGLPLAYTGIVSEKPVATEPGSISAALNGAPFVLASVGGDDRMNLLERTLEAWKWLRESGHLKGWKLVLCQGLSGSADRLVELARQHGDEVILRPFTADFLSWLQVAGLSVSGAGYNTCANILETRVRAVLVPDPETSDQVTRATLLAARQVATIVAPAALNGKSLAQAMLKSLASVPSHHDIALDGAERTCALIEEIAAEGLSPGYANSAPPTAR